MTSPWIGVIGVVAVGVVAMMLRRSRGGDEQVTMPPAAAEMDEPPMSGSDAPVMATGADEDTDEADAEHLALTSDGLAFAPHGHGVVIAPQTHFRRPTGDDAGTMRSGGEEANPQPPVFLSPGDLIAARVVRGSPDLDPWRLETLGRDRDLVVWAFETRDAADAAHALLERRAVRPARDADGEPIVVGDEDFDAAQAELERTLHELSAELPDDDEPAGHAPR
ncbi:MAG: hypothetical protein ACHQ52_13270 [Candidatus Eisenbacteria bacterium]